MAKSILMSIRPQWVVKILNGEKTVEIRKKFPKDYVGWVYIYCTKEYQGSRHVPTYYLNGKVVARFWCDKVEEITPSTTNNFTKDSCLTIQELENYLWSNILFGYAIHITKLEIFDKPKEISEFYAYCKGGIKCLHCKHYWTDDSAGYSISKCGGKPLTRAPQSWCYIEV